jgi:hypothetical protein
MFALMAMMFLFAGKSSAQQVKTDYDRSADFSLSSRAPEQDCYKIATSGCYAFIALPNKVDDSQ